MEEPVKDSKVLKDGRTTGWKEWVLNHYVVDCHTPELMWMRNDVLATNTWIEALVFWPPDAKSQLIGKDLNAGKDWGQEEKRVREDELVR